MRRLIQGHKSQATAVTVLVHSAGALHRTGRWSHVPSTLPFTGTPPVSGEPWTREVEWVRGNLLEPQTYRDQLVGAAAAISCVGGFGSQEEMLKVSAPGLSWGEVVRGRPA